MGEEGEGGGWRVRQRTKGGEEGRKWRSKEEEERGQGSG